MGKMVEGEDCGNSITEIYRILTSCGKTT